MKIDKEKLRRNNERIAQVSADFWADLLKKGIPDNIKERQIVTKDDVIYYWCSHQENTLQVNEEAISNFRRTLYEYILGLLEKDEYWIVFKTDDWALDKLGELFNQAGLHRSECYVPFKAYFRIADRMITYSQWIMEDVMLLYEWEQKDLYE